LIAHLFFLPAVAKYAFHLLILLWIHSLNGFFSKHSNHKPIGIEILYLCFLCFTTETAPDRNVLLCLPNFQRFSAVCTASCSTNAFALSDKSFMFRNPEDPVLCCFSHFASSNVKHPFLLIDYYFHRFTSIKPSSLVGDFCSFRIAVSNFQHSDLLILPASFFRHNLNTTIKFAPYSSFTLDYFTLLALYQKIKFVQL